MTRLPERQPVSRRHRVLWYLVPSCLVETSTLNMNCDVDIFFCQHLKETPANVLTFGRGSGTIDFSSSLMNPSRSNRAFIQAHKVSFRGILKVCRRAKLPNTRSSSFFAIEVADERQDGASEALRGRVKSGVVSEGLRSPSGEVLDTACITAAANQYLPTLVSGGSTYHVLCSHSS